MTPAFHLLMRAIVKPVAPAPVQGAADPVVVSGSQRKSSWTSAGTHTLTTGPLLAGDIIVSWGVLYEAATTPVEPTISDNVFGAHDKAVASALNIDAFLGNASTYTTFNGFTKRVTSAQPAGVTLTIAGGVYVTMQSLVVRGANAVTPLDVPVASYLGQGTIGIPATVNMQPTTYPNDLILCGVTWYESAQVQVPNAAWPVIDGYNDGDSNKGQMVVLGKTVTATGDYDPTINPAANSSTYYAMVAFAFKGTAA